MLKTKWKRITFKIALNPCYVDNRGQLKSTTREDGVRNGLSPLKGYGLFAVAKDHKTWYAVTHLPSGKKVGSRSKLVFAKDLLLSMQGYPGVDWSVASPVFTEKQNEDLGYLSRLNR